ncbi:hypothetical protein LSAT2_005383 [Lamellibrachia satsuma]|nr:hypothetical protein LSAT2_005383 [Lamellibrachia satsuma]
MKELEVELEQLRLLVVTVVGREQVGCASGSGGGAVDDKVGEDDERDAKESSPQPGLRGGDRTKGDEKERNRREDKWIEGKGSGGDSSEGVGGKVTIVKAMGVRETTEAQVSQATGEKGDRLMSERQPDNSLPPSDKVAGQNVMEGIHRKSCSEALIEGHVMTLKTCFMNAGESDQPAVDADAKKEKESHRPKKRRGFWS